MTDYRSYLKGIDESLDILSVFEIGGAGHRAAPVIDQLEERKAGKIVYRGIEDPFRDHRRDKSVSVEDWYRHYSKELFAEHEASGDRIDKLILPWDATDIPYPFESGSFDEFHCHMIDEQIISFYDEDVLPNPTIEQFVDEIGRLSNSQGRAYLTIQAPLFFGHECTMEDFVSLLEQMAGQFKKHDFRVDLVHQGTKSFGRHLGPYLETKEFDFPVGELDYSKLSTFTDETAVDALIIASRMP